MERLALPSKTDLLPGADRCGAPPQAHTHKLLYHHQPPPPLSHTPSAARPNMSPARSQQHTRPDYDLMCALVSSDNDDLRIIDDVRGRCRVGKDFRSLYLLLVRPAFGGMRAQCPLTNYIPTRMTTRG